MLCFHAFDWIVLTLFDAVVCAYASFWPGIVTLQVLNHFFELFSILFQLILG